MSDRRAAPETHHRDGVLPVHAQDGEFRVPALPPNATLLVEETEVGSDWHCVTTIWQTMDGTFGVSVHAFNSAVNGASVHVLAEGLSTIDQINAALFDEALEAERFAAPADFIRTGVNKALDAARQTVTP